MRSREIMKKCMWILMVILLSFLMIQAGKNASENIWIEGDPTFYYYVALIKEILKGIAVFVPVWLLSVLGLARSFLGENWFPFAQKIPVRVTKTVLIVSLILLVGVTVVGKVYVECSEAPYHVRYAMETGLQNWRTVSAWTLVYSILLYVEQWSIQKNCGRQDIRKKQRWVGITIFLIWLILFELSCVDLWYIPQEQVGDLNSLEDYDLWWFSLYCAVFCLPLLFFSTRKTIRLFKNDDRWLVLSNIIPRKLTMLSSLLLTSLMIWQIREARSDSAAISSFDVPEYLQAAAKGHTFRALLWGLALFYTICLLITQIRTEHRNRSLY